ncbi:recombinase family protein [Dyadobacter chenwenxiniae]|uniref:recombinase family protein n=1 Tax=Dyadobacter chenwenxiniae TaxID=2906456 RepID=UPI0035B672AC
MSGTITERHGLNEIKKFLRSGDTLVVWRLDRLGRSLKDLIDWVTYLENKKHGKLYFQPSENLGGAQAHPTRNGTDFGSAP